MNDDGLLTTLRALEVELHHPGLRCSRARLMQLLHPAFHEVGRSGRRYDLATVIDFLAQQATAPDVRSDDFQVVALAADVALLTYRSAQHQADGSRANHTLRMSLWVNTGTAWQLRYHQGTPAAAPW